MVHAQLCSECPWLRYWSPVQIFCYHRINSLRQNLYSLCYDLCVCSDLKQLTNYCTYTSKGELHPKTEWSTFGGVSTFTCSFTSVCPRLPAFTKVKTGILINILSIVYVIKLIIFKKIGHTWGWG